MNAVRVGQGRWINAIVTVASLLLLVYFSYHSLAGNHGYFALLELRAEQSKLTADLEDVRVRRERLSRRVDLMAQDRIDPDLLEETVRVNLGFAHPDDLIVFK